MKTQHLLLMKTVNILVIEVPPPHGLLKWMTSTDLNNDTLEVLSLNTENIKVTTITAIIQYCSGTSIQQKKTEMRFGYWKTLTTD